MQKETCPIVHGNALSFGYTLKFVPNYENKMGQHLFFMNIH